MDFVKAHESIISGNLATMYSQLTITKIANIVYINSTTEMIIHPPKMDLDFNLCDDQYSKDF